MAQRTTATRLTFSLLTIFIWATGYITLRISSGYFTPLALSCIRLLFSGAALGLVLLFRRPKKMTLRDFPYFLLTGTCGYTVYYFFISLGTQTVTASVSSFIVSLAPVITPMFALLILKEKMSSLKWISVGVAALGVGILLFSDSSFSLDLGVLWVFIAALLFSLFNIVQRILLLRGYTSFDITVYASLLSTAMLLPMIPSAFREAAALPPTALWVAAYLGISSTIAYFFWAKALGLAAYTSEVTNFMFLTPILTTILGMVLLGEIPPLITYLGGAFMLLGVILVGFDQKKEQLHAERVEEALDGSEEAAEQK